MASIHQDTTETYCCFVHNGASYTPLFLHADISKPAQKKRTTGASHDDRDWFLMICVIIIRTLLGIILFQGRKMTWTTARRQHVIKSGRLTDIKIVTWRDVRKRNRLTDQFAIPRDRMNIFITARQFHPSPSIFFCALIACRLPSMIFLVERDVVRKQRSRLGIQFVSLELTLRYGGGRYSVIIPLRYSWM